MLARAALIASLVAAPAAERPHAGDRTWEVVRTCLDRHLPPFVGSPESSRNVFLALRTVCDAPIEDALAVAARQLADTLGAVDLAEVAMAEPLLRRRMDRLLLAYVIKFRAVGGPTTLDP